MYAHRDRLRRSQDFKDENISSNTSSERSTMEEGAKRAIVGRPRSRKKVEKVEGLPTHNTKDTLHPPPSPTKPSTPFSTPYQG